MKIELKFESKKDLYRLILMLIDYSDLLEDFKYRYCPNDRLLEDIAILNSVRNQINEAIDDL